MNRKIITLVAAVILAVIIAYSYFGMSKSAETIKISGAFALYPMTVKWTEEYQKIHPETKIEVSAGGAGKGMTDTL